MYLALTETEIQLLVDIRHVLQVFHCVQELVSAEKTPTLSTVLPMYERLITMLTELLKAMPQLAFAIDAGINKLREYLNYSQNTRMYILAMGRHFFFVVNTLLTLDNHLQSSILPSNFNG
jgi:hypothetical protein